MADNQMVKIVFDFDLGNVPASAKKLSQYLKDNNLDLKFTKQSVDAATASLKQFATAQNAAGAAAATTGNQLKKSNMQWTNLALVIQDLPYGFRGIQNNLPALIGGFAGMSGAIYLAGSAIIAFFTAYNMGLFDSISTTNKFEAANKKAIESVSQEATKVALLVAQYKDSNTSALERKEIIKELNSINPQYFGNLDKEKTSVTALNDAYLAYVGNLGNVIKAKKLEEQLTKKIEERLKFETEAGIALLKSGYRNPELIDEQNAALKKYNGMLQQEADLAERITNLSKVSVPIKTGGAQAKLEDPTIKLLEAKKQYYKDDLLMSASFEQEILARQKDLAVRQAEIEGKSQEQIKIIRQTYEQLILNSQAETGRKIIEEQSKLGAEQAKEYDKEVKEEEKRNKERIARGQKGYEDSLKTVSEFYKNKMNLATGDKNQQIAILQEEQAYFDILYGFNLISYEDYVKKTGEITKQQIGLNNALIKSSAQATLQLGMAIMSALAPAFDMMVEKGASIGEALESVFTNLLKQLAKVIVTAAIAVALMAALGLVDFAAIGSTFKSLVSQGMGLPKMGAGAGGGVSQPLTMFDGFANGGIISGPTYGLMGEYPGAQNNPEVVAPLDKLKDMIGGGGGGTFMLRGQDLLLSVNRAQKASNLKGQNISLA
jgi:hypothetical protein